MSITKEQQQALDDALVPWEQRLKIGSCNYRLSTTFKPKEPTFQVALDVLSLTPFYQAFLITASVPVVYMHEFWATTSFHKHNIRFKLNTKRYSFDLETFRNMLQICPNLPGQKFVDPPFEEEILTFMRELGYYRNIKLLSDVKVEILPQPWRTFGTIINKCLSGKVTGIDSLRLSRAQILWGLYQQKKVDYVYLLWEDLVFQIKNKESRKNKYMYYPRFTKVIINHFMSQDQSIPRRNKVDWHMTNDDPILTTMRFIPQHEVVQKYDAILPDNLTTQAMKESEAYKTYYAFATGKAIPKPKYVRRSTKEKTVQAPKASSGSFKVQNVEEEKLNEENKQRRGRSEPPSGRKRYGNDDAHALSVSTTQVIEQTNQFAEAISSILGIVDKYLADRMNNAVNTAVQLQSDRLREQTQAENQEFIDKINEGMNKIIKDQVNVQVKEQVSKILPRIEKLVNDQLEAEVLIRSSNEAKSSHAVAANLSEMELKKILIDKMENNKSINTSDQQKNLYNALAEAYEADKDILDTYGDTVTIKIRREDKDEDEEPSAGSDRGSKRRRARKELESTTEEPTHTAKDLEEPAHQEFKTGFTKDPLVHETSQYSDCSTLAKLHFGSSRKEDTREPFNELMDTPLDFSAFVMNRLKVDTLTPELLADPTFKLMKDQQYPHDLRKPLPLIPNSRGRQVIPFDHFINNDLAYLKGGEYAHDVYSRQRIITVTELQIVEWHNYKYLDWITIRRNDNKLYKLKEGDFKRLRLQDIEDMLLLLVQGKLTNLTVEERLAFNVSLRMFTRSIVIQRRVEDLQLAYSNLRGFIYQNKDKKNILMRIDKLHKFSDGTLNDVRTTLDDTLKGIQMKYLPHTIWRKSDRDKAGAMIQEIGKQLKTRRIMRSLEKFVSGRPYAGDLRLLERTI
ncbi:hypothetical protein Tco_0173434 [Tanacetum coccineum]